MRRRKGKGREEREISERPVASNNDNRKENSWCCPSKLFRQFKHQRNQFDATQSSFFFRFITWPYNSIYLFSIHLSWPCSRSQTNQMYCTHCPHVTYIDLCGLTVRQAHTNPLVFSFTLGTSPHLRSFIHAMSLRGIETKRAITLPTAISDPMADLTCLEFGIPSPTRC